MKSEGEPTRYDKAQWSSMRGAVVVQGVRHSVAATSATGREASGVSPSSQKGDPTCSSFLWARADHSMVCAPGGAKRVTAGPVAEAGHDSALTIGSKPRCGPKRVTAVEAGSGRSRVCTGRLQKGTFAPAVNNSLTFWSSGGRLREPARRMRAIAGLAAWVGFKRGDVRPQCRNNSWTLSSNLGRLQRSNPATAGFKRGDVRPICANNSLTLWSSAGRHGWSQQRGRSPPLSNNSLTL